MRTAVRLVKPKHLAKNTYSVPAAAYWSSLFVELEVGFSLEFPVALSVIPVWIYVFTSALLPLMTYEPDASLLLFTLT